MANALNLWHPVSAPPAVPYRFGLFSVVAPQPAIVLPNGEIDEHWRAGITWQSQACHQLNITQGECIDPGGTVYANPLVEDNYCSVPMFDPFTVYTYNNDAVPGRTLEEHRQDTLDRFTAGEQAAVENQVISNIANNLTTPAVDLSAFLPKFALGAAEQRIAQLYGGQGVIYITRQAATIMWENLRVEGQRLVTTLGTPVVAWGGQNGPQTVSPALASIYVTGAPVMYRGDIDVREWAIDKAINRGSWIAQRDYVFGWDCGAAAFTVDLSLGNYTPPI